VATSRQARAILRRHYRTSDWKVRAYNRARLLLLPIPWLTGLLDPLRGTVLCLGCGFGPLETVLAGTHPQLDFTASDLNERRIAAAQAWVRGLPNIRFEVTDATAVKTEETYDNVFFCDLLHHLGAGQQPKLLESVWPMLKPGGALVIKDVDVAPRWKYWWNYLHDRVVAGPPLTYLPRADYRRLLTDLGAEVTESIPRTALPYAHYALVARKPAA